MKAFLMNYSDLKSNYSGPIQPILDGINTVDWETDQNRENAVGRFELHSIQDGIARVQFAPLTKK